MLIILHRLSALGAFWARDSGQNCFKLFLAIFGHFWPCYLSKAPDSDSSHLADHFAPVISSRGLLGLEIQGKIVSNCFWLFSGISGLVIYQKHRIRNPRILLIILHRLSALEAFWGSIFRPKSFQIVFVYFRALQGMKRTKNTGFGFLASCWSFCTGYQLSGPSGAWDSGQNRFKSFSVIFKHFCAWNMPKTPDSESLQCADHFAPVISARGLLGLHIWAKIVSSCFRSFSGSSGYVMCQKRRIRIPCIVLIIFHRLSALGAF